jgi:DNA-binding transcriptional LysR family regulator
MSEDKPSQSNFLPLGMSQRHGAGGSRMLSPKALLVFTTAARHLNLVRAAEEMNVTQGALSKQIKALEQQLGVVLFQRGPRGLTLSEAGEVLYDYTSHAFNILQQGIGRLTINTQRESLVVSVARAFAVRVLAPRLRSFIDAHPWVDLQIDVHRYFADLNTSKIDVSIRAGAGDWPDYSVFRLTRDRLFPVCAPALWKGAAGTATQDFLRSVPRLDYAEKDNWGIWLDAAGLGDAPPAGLIGFNDSAAMLAAAEAGVGLALPRSSLVADALARGTLVKPYSVDVEDGIAYYAVSAPRAAQRRPVGLFLEWLDAEFAAAR